MQSMRTMKNLIRLCVYVCVCVGGGGGRVGGVCVVGEGGGGRLISIFIWCTGQKVFFFHVVAYMFIT